MVIEWLRVRSGRGGTAGLALALLVATSPARPESDDEAGENARRLSATVVFSTMEASRTKTFSGAGFKTGFGSGGLDASGFRLLATASASREPAFLDPDRGDRYKSQAVGLLGYEWVASGTHAALYFGPEAEREQVVLDCGCTALRQRYGARLQGDLWYRPAPAWLVQAAGSASSLDRRLWGRVAGGFAVLDEVFFGPEIEAYRDAGYRRLRLGLHLTGVRVFRMTLRLSGGWQRSSDGRGEAYGTLGAHWRY